MKRAGEATVLILVMAVFIAAFSYLSTYAWFVVDRGLVGALVGAAGTIFAGWLVWTQTRDQIAANERIQALNEQRNNEVKIRTLNGEIKYLELAGEFLDRLLQPFADAADDGSDYRVRLSALSARGELISPSIIGVGFVGVVATSLSSSISRLMNLRNGILLFANVPDGPARLVEINTAIETNVAELRQLRASLHAEIAARQSDIARLAPK